jgi:hypothetical protein
VYVRQLIIFQARWAGALFLDRFKRLAKGEVPELIFFGQMLEFDAPSR